VAIVRAPFLALRCRSPSVDTLSGRAARHRVDRRWQDDVIVGIAAGMASENARGRDWWAAGDAQGYTMQEVARRLERAASTLAQGRILSRRRPSTPASAPDAGLRLAGLPHDPVGADTVGRQQHDGGPPCMLLRRIAVLGNGSS
jgi:hypothetical protein